MNKLVVGIDLGTTFSAIAYVDDEGRPRVIPNADGQTTTPSVVLIENGRIEVGEVAVNQWVTNEAHVVRWIKRAMGDLTYRFQGLSPIEISAEILKALKRDAERELGQVVEEAVITCPAYFNGNEIENTKKAGELAGLKVREIVKEPTAAAVYYGVEHMRDGETILVCDLGGGTFDATVLSYQGGVFKPLATKGDRELGGHDWTVQLEELVAERLQPLLGEDPRNDARADQTLYEACEQAKRDFARLTEISIPCHFRGRMEQVTVTRDEFESRTEYKIEQMILWVKEALAKAPSPAQPPLTWREIDRILLVGGSSRLRRMGAALEEVSGKKPVESDKPDLMVALGAAIIARGQVRARRAAGGLADAPRGGLMEVNPVRTITRNLGTRVIAFENQQPRLVNSLIIPHGTESPVTLARDDYEVAAHGQQYFNVPVIEFEDDDTRDLIGNFRFTCLPGAARGDRIKVTFNYDLSGIPTVDAHDLKSGRQLHGEKMDYVEPDLDQVSLRIKPRWVVFAVDASYSMNGEKLRAAKQALVNTARQLIAISGGQCQVGIVSFDSSARAVISPTSDLTAIEAAANSLVVGGSTAMDEGIERAVELAMGAPAGTDRDVAIITDGMPDDRDRTLAAAADAKAKGVTLSSVGIGEHAVDQNFLRQLSPISLVIKGAQGVEGAIQDMLRQAEQHRGGALTETTKGSLSEG